MDDSFAGQGVLVTGGSRGIGRAVANAVVALVSPGLEYAIGTILDLNGASYLRT